MCARAVPMIKLAQLLLASLCALPSCQPCGGSTTDIGCEDSLTIRLSKPLQREYDFEVSGRGATPIIEGGAVVALSLVGRVDGTLNVVVRHDGRQLWRDTVVPKYTEPEECSGLCRKGEVTLNTDAVPAIESASGMGGSRGDGGPESGAGVGGADPAFCDRTAWTGSYTASYEAISTSCPELPNRAWDFAMGIEQSLFCGVENVQWSDDGCTRSALVSCSGQVDSYQWTLVLTESSEGHTC